MTDTLDALPPNQILFVCRENTGRSQVAKALCCFLSTAPLPQSAGIIVDRPGEIIGRCPEATTVITAMQNLYGLDIAGQERTQLTPGMLLLFKRVIVMAEPDCIPGWLAGNNVEYHPIDDLKGQDYDATTRIIGTIGTLVSTLLKAD